jgi:integrase
MIKPRLRRRDGRKVYDVRLRDPSGKVYGRTFETKKAAEGWQADERSARNSGHWIDPRLAATPYRKVAEDWLGSNPRKRASTMTRDRMIVRKHVLPALGDRPVASITRANILSLVKAWADYEPATINRMFATLRATFNHAMLLELIVRNPCHGIKRPTVLPRDAQILDADDIDRLAAAMGDQGPMVYLAALGLRWGEIAGLRVGRIDFLRQTITIAVQRTAADGSHMVEGEPKTKAGKRTISVPDWMTAMLADHLAARGLTGADADAHVFVTVKGNPLTYTNWWGDVWVPARALAGFPDLHFHDLRHTAATVMVTGGVDPKTAQARLGHRDLRTTLAIYAQVTEKSDREAAEKIGDRLRPRDRRAIDG